MPNNHACKNSFDKGITVGGIAGSYKSRESSAIREMLRQLAHRGPDGNGIVELPESVLGQTRLAIVDPRYRQLPMGRNGTWIAFSGEIYNYRELRASELSSMQLRSNSDTEVLLELFRRDGPACVEKLDGMFAIAIMHGGELFLARDPLGIQPLYIGWHNDLVERNGLISSMFGGYKNQEDGH